MSWLAAHHSSYLMISFHDGKIEILKNRLGDIGEVDMVGLLEAIKDHSPDFKSIIDNCVGKIKLLKAFI